jgi:hypothetical protein
VLSVSFLSVLCVTPENSVFSPSLLLLNSRLVFGFGVSRLTHAGGGRIVLRRIALTIVMKNAFLICIALAATFLATSTPLFAHHGNSDYDRTKEVTFHATVTDFLFVNPHSLLFFTVKDSQGKLEEWQGELQSPSMLSRKGHWTKDTVKPGDQITIVGNPVKNGSKNLIVNKVILADGQEFPGG